MSTEVAIFASVATLLSGLISALIAYSAQYKNILVTKENNHLDHNDSLLGAYSQMVDDLRSEVSRLKTTIDQMRIEQSECDKRNFELEQLVHNLHNRLEKLENYG